MKMKKILMLMATMLTLATTEARAVPAKPGLWTTITAADGRSVRVQLAGDERHRYWQTAEGRIYVKEDGAYTELSAERLAARRSSSANLPAQQARRKRAARSRALYQGEKRGLVVLVGFADKKFQAAHDANYYNDVCNTKDFTSNEGYRGSVRDYFLAQSYGQFGLTFDVVGPITLPKGYAYYGKNQHNSTYDQDEDAHAGEMVAEACKAIDGEVDFSRYDWDGDGYVDQVMVIYAGKGEHDGGGDDTIWPHEYQLRWSDYGDVLRLDGVSIDTYACSCELTRSSRVEGIGTICHEFSHCLGLPDYYDTNYSGNYGLGSWSLMSGGSYNGSGFCPAGYTSLDKMMCGWLEPTELTTDTIIGNMAPLSEEPCAYKLTNAGKPDEFYMIENRQQTGWDAGLPGKGLIVMHVDYDETVWAYNEPNTTEDAFSGNDHQRCTIFHADNRDTNEAGDPYPFGTRDSLTRQSLPSAKLYNYNVDGSLLMDRSILDIARNGDGSMTFRIRKEAIEPIEHEEGVTVFYESFDRCNGTGGNDNLWEGNIAMKILVPDNSGWNYSNGKGAKQCAKFGTTTYTGVVTTPNITVSGKCTLTFKAAPWGSESGDLLLQASGNATLETSTFVMKNSEWTEFSTTVDVRQGYVNFTFIPAKRFFLDEVRLVTGATSAIRDVSLARTSARSLRIYNLKGQYVGSDPTTLPKGLYVRDGRKFSVGK